MTCEGVLAFERTRPRKRCEPFKCGFFTAAVDIKNMDNIEMDLMKVLVSSVARWLYYYFNIWPFATLKIYPTP